MKGARLDGSGVISPCSKCGALNRMGYSSLHQEAKCGSCREALEKPGAPVEAAEESIFKQAVQGSSLPVVVDFWAEWCGPCKMFAPEFARMAGEWKGRALFLKVNTGQIPQISQQMGINAIPTIVIWKAGKERERIQGAVSGVVLSQAISRANKSEG